MPCRDAALRLLCGRGIGLAMTMTAAIANAQAPPAAPAASAPAAAASAAQLERVQIRAARPSDVQERRESTAAKIVIGRDEIERYGDSNLGDVLKRLPGVTLQGRPGRGGAIRMRGLGSGYTQILLDGQRIPPGFSLDSLTPEQIERIEILRAPTAETGARAIAGTINIVTREGFDKHINDVRAALAAENGRLQPSLSWTRNEPLGPFIVNSSISAFATDRESGATTTTVDRRLVDDSVALEQRDEARVRERRRGLHATGRLQWRSESGVDSVILMPLLIHGSGTTQRDALLTQPIGAVPPAFDASHTDGDGDFTLLRLNTQWNHRLDGGGRLEGKAGLGRGHTRTRSLRREYRAGTLDRTLDDHGDTIDRNLIGSGKLVHTLAGGHSLVAGVEAETNRRRERRETNDPALLANFGDNVAASSLRTAAYAQDEWALTPQWAAHAGLRWEGIATSGESGLLLDQASGSGEQRNRSSVWTPLLHAVWRPLPESRDQVRLSLTRSYRSPTLSQLIGRPSINNRNPAPGPNTPTQPDRAGNPALKPELATGIDIAVERYLDGGGLLSANLFHRQLRNYLRNQTMLESVPWSPGQPRYVSRPQNIGGAITQGIELEAKFRSSDWLAGAPKIDVRANASLFRSRVKAVPGPDNRLDQQPPYTANLGADYRVPGWPLTLGGNVNQNPAYDTRISEIQTAYQGRKRVVDVYGLWVFSPTLQLRVTASNALAREYLSGGSVDDVPAALRETSRTTAPTYLNLQARLEIRL